MRKNIKNLLVIAAALLCSSVFAYAHSEYSVSGAMITAYNGNEDVVTVPLIIDGVMIAGIDTGAFKDKDMHTVIIEEGIEVIQPKAFVGCSNLQYVKSPESMLLINEDAFFECSSQLQLDVSDSTYVMDREQTATLLEDTENPEGTEQPEETEDESYNGFLYSDNTILGYIGEETDIIIPDSINDVTITTIKANAFEGNTLITSVIIPDTITTIGASAFKGCTSLAEVSLSKNLSSAGVEIFNGCTSLKSVTIPGTLKRIPQRAFYNCTSLTDVVIESGVKSMAPYAFCNCTNLKNVSAPNTITSIETWSFGYCKNLEYFDIPDQCTFLDSAVFYYCILLNNIHIPDTVKTLGTQCFRECWSLSDITLSNSISSIQYRTFHNCSFSEIEIPHSVTSIGSGAFYQCTQMPLIEIPETVTSISTGAFYGCSGLEKIIVYGENTELTDIYKEDRTGVINRGKAVLYVVSDSVGEKYGEESGYPYVSLSGTANIVNAYFAVNNAITQPNSNTVLVDDDYIYAKYNVINVGEESQNLRLLICLYNDEGRFVKIACSSPASVEINSIKEIEVALNIDFVTEESELSEENESAEEDGCSYYAKVMLIDGFEMFVPLYELKEF